VLDVEQGAAGWDMVNEDREKSAEAKDVQLRAVKPICPPV
jgi:hypothetical protein